MSMVEDLVNSFLAIAGFSVLPFAIIATARRFVGRAIAFSLLGLGLSLLAIGIIKRHNVDYQDIVILPFISIEYFGILLFLNLLLLWIYKDD